MKDLGFHESLLVLGRLVKAPHFLFAPPTPLFAPTMYSSRSKPLISFPFRAAPWIASSLRPVRCSGVAPVKHAYRISQNRSA